MGAVEDGYIPTNKPLYWSTSGSLLSSATHDNSTGYLCNAQTVISGTLSGPLIVNYAKLLLHILMGNLITYPVSQLVVHGDAGHFVCSQTPTNIC
jgi:hypothetical protein